MPKIQGGTKKMKTLKFKCISEIESRILEKHQRLFEKSVENQAKYYAVMVAHGRLYDIHHLWRMRTWRRCGVVDWRRWILLLPVLFRGHVNVPTPTLQEIGWNPRWNRIRRSEGHRAIHEDVPPKRHNLFQFGYILGCFPCSLCGRSRSPLPVWNQ